MSIYSFIYLEESVNVYGGEEQGERERENLKGAPHPMWSPLRGLISQP